MLASARDAFDRDGLVHLPGALDAASVAAMRAALWSSLAPHAITPDPHTWRAGGSLPLAALSGALRPGAGTESFLWSIGRAPAFAPLVPAFARAVDAVFGPRVWQPIDDAGGLAAPNFPLPAAPPWRVPSTAWHVDEPTAPHQPHPWGLLGFAFLDDVAPGGGATVAIAGSHRLLGTLAPTLTPDALLTTVEALPALAPDPWFAALLDDAAPDRAVLLSSPHTLHSIPLRLVELTGTAGDLFLLDPRCLHTVSPNTASRARLTMRLVCARA